MSRIRSQPNADKFAAYQDCSTRGLTTEQTADALGVKRYTVRAYAKDNGLAFADYNPCAIKQTPAPAPIRDVWVIEKHGVEGSRNPITMRVSLPKPPFEIDIKRSA